MNVTNYSKFVATKRNIFNDNSKANFNAGNEIIFNTEFLKSYLCDYTDVYILVRGDTTATAALLTKVAFKNFAPFTKYSTKIDETTKDDAENLDFVMTMYNLIKNAANEIFKNATIAVPLNI